MEVETFRCTTCGAPLEVGDAAGPVRCAYCGTGHRLVDRTADTAGRLQKDRRLGAVFGPYLFMPALGFAAALAAHDLWWSSYDGYPSVALGVMGLIATFAGFRMSGALVLALTGLATAIKPWVRPIPGYDGHWFSPTSETGFYYLVPGVIAVAVALLVLASLRIREVGPALRALRPRISVAVALLVGAAGGWFFVHPTNAELVEPHRAAIHSLQQLAREACVAPLGAASDPVALAPPPRYQRYADGNAMIASCAAFDDPYGVNRDPLYLDDRANELFSLIGDRHVRRMQFSANDRTRRLVAAFGRLRWLVAYRMSDDGVVAAVLDIRAGHLVGVATAPPGRPADTRKALLANLAKLTGGSFSTR